MLSVLALCLGASLGAIARWRLGLWLSTPGALLPWGTLAANLIGGYLVGIAIAVFQALPQLDPAWRLALVTGFLGALTTFSSFSGEVVAELL
ncbi:MAG: fluoride efflux transporter CrcB, partial [Hylemonella sp.]|nr:fluoride efflux transporter CrcB [Hylemonella sp.]